MGFLGDAAPKVIDAYASSFLIKPIEILSMAISNRSRTIEAINAKVSS
ncbi:MAG: hypothetical protein R2806_10745 [Saprospiraceae bacterium]